MDSKKTKRKKNFKRSDSKKTKRKKYFWTTDSKKTKRKKNFRRSSNVRLKSPPKLSKNRRLIKSKMMQFPSILLVMSSHT